MPAERVHMMDGLQTEESSCSMCELAMQGSSVMPWFAVRASDTTPKTWSQLGLEGLNFGDRAQPHNFQPIDSKSAVSL